MGRVVSFEEFQALGVQVVDFFSSLVEGGVEVALDVVVYFLQEVFGDGQDELFCLLGGSRVMDGSHRKGAGWYALGEEHVVEIASRFMAYFVAPVHGGGWWVDQEVIYAAGVMKFPLLVAIEGV